jgi:hypothetical protein
LNLEALAESTLMVSRPFVGCWPILVSLCQIQVSPSHVDFGVFSLAEGVERIVGVHLVVAVVAHVGRFRAFAHGALDSEWGRKNAPSIHWTIV